MTHRRIVSAALVLVSGVALAGVARAADVAVCTDLGRFTIELDAERAPQHVANFLSYVERGFYQGTVFHRVIDGFMIQGGGFDGDLQRKPAAAPVRNESRNGLKNTRGTVAAARTSDPHSATSQFYINLVDNPSLDAGRDWGYTVFGRVMDGMNVVDEIGALPTGASGPFRSDVPEPLVAITSMARLDGDAPESGAASAGDDDAAAGAADARQQLGTAVEEGRYVDALGLIGRIRAACEPMDADLLLTEARVAAGLLRGPRARAALEQYFATADEAHAGYGEASELRELLAAPVGDR